jgi:hypothetical protein
VEEVDENSWMMMLVASNGVDADLDIWYQDFRNLVVSKLEMKNQEWQVRVIQSHLLILADPLLLVMVETCSDQPDSGSSRGRNRS